MGVRTVVFGPRAWRTLEGMAAFYDEYMAMEHDLDMKDMFREFFFLLGFVLPCVYCRISYRQFTDPAHPTNQQCDITRMLGEKNGAKKLVYHLHQRVSTKLRDQEREVAVENPEKLESVNRKWAQNMISWQEALKNRFKGVGTQIFWNSAIVFLALVMCDYRKEDSCYIHRLFWLLGKIICKSHRPTEQKLAQIYMTTFEKSQPLWLENNFQLEDRLDIVWSLKRALCNNKQWDFGSTRQQFVKECKKAIVGCMDTK